MTCAEVKEKLVDFLYDELLPEARTAFTQHLDGCPACKAEVASFQNTLGSTRAALAGQLSQEPPMRVRLAALEAAQAAKPSVAEDAPAARAKHATRATSDDDGFFTRLLRSPWFLPAFGAASVATVVFLVRVLKNPEVLPGQQPHAIEEGNVETPKPALPPVPVDRAIAAKPESGASGKGSAAASTPAKNAAALGMPAGIARAAAGTAKRKAYPELGRATDEGLFKPRPSSPGQAKDSDRFAEPPPPRPVPPAAPPEPSVAASGHPAAASEAAPSARPASAAAERRAMKPQIGHARDLDDLGDEMSKDVASPARKKKADSLLDEGPTAAKASVANEKAAREVGSALDDSLRKADRLFASQDWNAAANAYGDLLRRFPSHKDVPKWRDRMNTSTVEYQRTLEAKRKKAVSDDPPSGGKL
jgi:anti-sigma factor RsiW